MYFPRTDSELSLSRMSWSSSDIILDDDVFRSVYSIYDFSDIDASGKMGNPYLRFLSPVDSNAASKYFATTRDSVARSNISYNTVNSAAAPSGRTTVSLSDDITDTLNEINTYFPPTCYCRLYLYLPSPQSIISAEPEDGLATHANAPWGDVPVRVYRHVHPTTAWIDTTPFIAR